LQPAHLAYFQNNGLVPVSTMQMWMMMMMIAVYSFQLASGHFSTLQATV